MEETLFFHSILLIVGSVPRPLIKRKEKEIHLSKLELPLKKQDLLTEMTSREKWKGTMSSTFSLKKHLQYANVQRIYGSPILFLLLHLLPSHHKSTQCISMPLKETQDTMSSAKCILALLSSDFSCTGKIQHVLPNRRQIKKSSPMHSARHGQTNLWSQTSGAWGRQMRSSRLT